MSTRPVTLFTAQWADLPFEEVARLASEWGFDGLEIACKSQHLDVDRALEDEGYLDSRREILDRYGLGVWALSNHAQGQVVCDDPLDFRHQSIVGSRTWETATRTGSGPAPPSRSRRPPSWHASSAPRWSPDSPGRRSGGTSRCTRRCPRR